MSRDDYEAEWTASREAIAAVLSGVADGLLTGAIQLGDGDDAVTVDAPDVASLEIEFETDADGSSLELELEWPTDDSEASLEAVASPGEEATDTASAPATTPDEVEMEMNAAAASDAVPAPVRAVDGSQSLARFEVFRDRGGEWRWRLRHRNGNVIATSGEGYSRKHNAWKGLRSVMANSAAAEIVDESSD